MILLSIKDDIECKNVKEIIKELGINEKVISVNAKTPDLSKKELKKFSIIITDFNEEKIKEIQSSKKEIIVFLGKRPRKSLKENEILYNKNTSTYASKNELREILTFYAKRKKMKKMILPIFLSILVVALIVVVLSKINLSETKKELKTSISTSQKEEKPKDIKKEKLKYENIVFLGDSLTDLYNLTKYYPEIPVINSGTCGFVTEDVLENLRNYVYVYNPTKVFLLIGTNDISLTDNTNEEIISNIKKIVEEIHEYRPNTQIYVESLYPINNNKDDYEKINMNMVKDRTNPRIKEINKLIHDYCDEKKLEYINMYDELADENGDLKIEYTADGLHMTEAGYEVITKKIMEYIENDIMES